MKDWSSYEKSMSKGPVQFSIKIIVTLFLLGGIVWGIGSVFSWFGEATTVVREEFGPREALKKYEWFKDAAAELDKKVADISVYKARETSLTDAYIGVPRKDWPRSDREQISIWSSESAGVKASYNSLAAEYNAQMAKFNWRFANVGELPQGATVALPREFKPYTGE